MFGQGSGPVGSVDVDLGPPWAQGTSVEVPSVRWPPTRRYGQAADHHGFAVVVTAASAVDAVVVDAAVFGVFGVFAWFGVFG